MKIHFNQDRTEFILSGIPPDDSSSDVMTLEDEPIMEVENGNDFLIDKEGNVYEMVPVDDLEVEENADLDAVLARLEEDDES